ncbi:MAG: DUF4150 domain-containing protein, partial [Planctomycetaceae bacterium]|nr:DUF4150 domain-containing protein [Planctomycetaceae bacterium]
MANQEGSAQKDDFIVVCRTPDVCKSPVAPTPHQIVGKLDQAILISPIPNGKGLVNFKSKPVFTMASRVATVVGDDAGIGGGVISGVNKGMCRPIRNQATKVNCNGAQVVRHDTEFGMNSAGPDGPPNTFGKLVYQGAMQSAPVPASGTIPPGANSIVAAENPGELGCLGDLSSISGSVGGLGDVVGLAQRAYNLATTDWSNPMAALGAIGGLGGMLGMKSLANTAALAQKAYGLARTD